MTDFDNDLTSKRLELLKAVAPKAVRVAYMNDDLGMRFSAAQADALNKEHDAAARALGISLLRVSFNAPRDFEAAAATIVRERADALLIGGVSATTLRNEIAEFAMRQRLPSLAAGRSNSLAGALMSYGDLADPTTPRTGARRRATWRGFSTAPSPPSCRSSDRRSWS